MLGIISPMNFIDEAFAPVLLPVYSLDIYPNLGQTAVIIQLIAATKTETGLRIRCAVAEQHYPKGIKLSKRPSKTSTTSSMQTSTAPLGLYDQATDAKIERLLFPSPF
jgi:hypothetical protein